MSQVKVKENESLESALRRFKRQTSRDGVIQEVRKREHYENSFCSLFYLLVMVKIILIFVVLTKYS